MNATHHPRLTDIEREIGRADRMGLARHEAPLLAAVHAVLELHRPGPGGSCMDCFGFEVWPCPTVRAIAAHVELGV